MELVYSKNYSNHPKIFVFKLYKMVANKTECSKLEYRLVSWVLWHINLCWLFNAKSIFMKIVLFQTIQFSTSAQFKCKYSLIVKSISISSYSVSSSSSNSAKYTHRFCLHTVKCQNSSILNNSI